MEHASCKHAGHMQGQVGRACWHEASLHAPCSKRHLALRCCNGALPPEGASRTWIVPAGVSSGTGLSAAACHLQHLQGWRSQPAGGQWLGSIPCRRHTASAAPHLR